VQTTPDGTDVYVEEYTVTSNINGLVSVEIGSGSQDRTSAEESLKSSEAATATIVSGDFSIIDWADGPYFIKVETDLNGGSDYTITGISQLLSVPYAKYADKAGNTKFRDGADTNDAVYTKGNVGIGTEEPDAPLSVKTDSVPAITISSLTKNNPDRPGIMFKNNTSHFISGDGLSDEYFGFYSKWSSERYYDAKLRVFGKAKKSWGTYLEMTHDGANATIRTDVGDISITPAKSLNLNPAGDLLLNPSGNISANNRNLTDVALPVNTSDAATKQYVDDVLSFLMDNLKVIESNIDFNGDGLSGMFCNAEFSVSKTNISYVENLGSYVAFKDLSFFVSEAGTYGFTDWFWDFGDGSTSTLQNPTHLYTNTGTYTVKLKVRMGLVSDSIVRENYIRVLNDFPTVTDRDGNVYPAVWIGDDLWMAECLKVKHYPNGDAIPVVDDFDVMQNYLDNKVGAYCYYNFDSNIGNDYGFLYTWEAATADNWSKDKNPGQGICPDGWHLPSAREWNELKDYLSTGTKEEQERSESIVNYFFKIREQGLDHWTFSSEDYTNETGFSAQGSGFYVNKSFSGLKRTFCIYLGTGAVVGYGNGWDFSNAEAVTIRCVKDK
jgi:uncharacterized protein (TIGR02145 family)